MEFIFFALVEKTQSSAGGNLKMTKAFQKYGNRSDIEGVERKENIEISEIE